MWGMFWLGIRSAIDSKPIIYCLVTRHRHVEAAMSRI
jgi:hypothetical protein